jgi:hypothetical protein
MGFFSDSKPKISETEFKKIRAHLYNKDFSSEQLDKIEGIFRGDLYEDKSSDKGIDNNELEKAISWMRENMHVHNISEEKINTLEEEMKKAL